MKHLINKAKGQQNTDRDNCTVRCVGFIMSHLIVPPIFFSILRGLSFFFSHSVYLFHALCYPQMTEGQTKKKHHRKKVVVRNVQKWKGVKSRIICEAQQYHYRCAFSMSFHLIFHVKWDRPSLQYWSCHGDGDVSLAEGMFAW